MPSALAEHAVEAQPDEQGDEGKDDDDGQFTNILLNLVFNIVRDA